MTKKIDGFCSVRSSTLTINRRLAMDIFIPVEGRPVRFAIENEIFEDERSKRLKKFKMSKVFIRAEQESVYRNYVGEILEQSERDPKSTTALKAQVITGATESAVEEVMGKVDDKATYTGAQAQFARFATFLQKHEGGFGEVIRLSGQTAGDYVSHEVQVAALSVFLCEHLKLIRDDEHRKQISTGCFLHDMEAEKFEIPLMFDKSQFSEEHKKLWLAHSTKAVETLGVLNHVDQQVLSIIAQHEEIPNGSGFPKKMIRKEMDPIACVVSLANRFDHYSTRHHGDKKAAIDEFFTAELGKYDLDQLELLRDVISKHV